jgi:uncharacterized membrane protein YdjX (TVP38/TMEM64 family)
MIEWMQEFAHHVAGIGVPLFLALWLLANVLPVPRWPFTVAGGALFGFGEGLALALVIGFLGSVGAFMLSRYVLRHEVQKIIERHPKLTAVDEAMREGGWKAVALLQISPRCRSGCRTTSLARAR